VSLRPCVPRLAPAFVALAGLMVLVGTVYFASVRSEYRHTGNTISELGERGAARARLVSFGLFLPVGLLVWLALWLAHRGGPERTNSVLLLAMSCLGTGYVVSAFFPCDPGAPLFGSWRTQVHNAAGFLDYGGTGIGFLLAARAFARRKAFLPTAASGAAGVLVLLCLALLCLESMRPLRGAVQRVAELIQFVGLCWLCGLLPGLSPRSRKPPETSRAGAGSLLTARAECDNTAVAQRDW